MSCPDDTLAILRRGSRGARIFTIGWGNDDGSPPRGKMKLIRAPIRRGNRWALLACVGGVGDGGHGDQHRSRIIGTFVAGDSGLQLAQIACEKALAELL